MTATASIVPRPSSPEVYDEIRGSIVANGQFDLMALVARLTPHFNERQIYRGFLRHVRRLRKEGLFVRSVRGKPGVYEASNTEHTVRRVMDSNRLRIVRDTRRAHEESIGAQRAPGLSDEERVRLNAQEVTYSRVRLMMEAQLLKRKVKRPEGLEP